MQKNYITERLLLDQLSLDDTKFISVLVNMPEWIRFIGNRNINNLEDAVAYVQKIIDNPDITYLVVKTREQEIPVGIISFIKRNYLEHHDIGFAFLNDHTKQGYAFEAASAVLHDAMHNCGHTEVLATTLKENTGSIKLLQKLGFHFSKEIINEGNSLMLFAIER